MIVEYMLTKMEDGRVMAPAWLSSGGFITNPDDKTFMGFCHDLVNREFYVPDAVVILTTVQAKARAVAIHALYPIAKEVGGVMTNAEVETMVQAIIDSEVI